MSEEFLGFFSTLWSTATRKHDQSIHNTVCLVVLLALPLVVLLTSLVVCCHCCCCHPGGCGPCSHSAGDVSTAGAKSDKKKKKKKNPKNEDLWISVKTEPMTPDRLALTVV